MEWEVNLLKPEICIPNLNSGNTSRNLEAKIIFKLQKFVLNIFLGLLHTCLTVCRILVLGAVNHTWTCLELSSICASCHKEDTALKKGESGDAMASFVLALLGWEAKSARGSGAPRPLPPAHAQQLTGHGLLSQGPTPALGDRGSKCHCGDKA